MCREASFARHAKPSRVDRGEWWLVLIGKERLCEYATEGMTEFNVLALETQALSQIAAYALTTASACSKFGNSELMDWIVDCSAMQSGENPVP